MSWSVSFNENGGASRGLPLWREVFCGVEAILLHAAPVYYGLGVPQGNGSGVIVIPGFLGTDAYLVEMYAWLHRLGYRPYFSGIGLNADCPNLIIRRSLNATIDRVLRETGGKVHLIGHSLGGMIAVSAAAQRPDDVESVTTLGAPFRGKVVHPNVHRAAELVRKWIQAKNDAAVLPACYTARCPCDFVRCLAGSLPDHVRMTAVYTRTDGVVDWRYCMTGDPEIDVEAPGTHIGLAFNPTVYSVIAKRLAGPGNGVRM